ncbi:MAG TPA: 4a-hydroxytetrahydrobiopterin dehydratase [Thioploca sp.]|nr:MAG: 4a-hydroxytetrahydrobiopterin dehydratase [Gammaproteobacteria bacterium]HDN25991.1 4a-hydroxytetrahydrobiopterin dehydratase [Thioploca sp.]
MSDLTAKRCKPCEGGVKPLTKEEAQGLLSQLQDWALNETATEISRTYKFKNYYETMAFVNAVAWIAHKEDHHPDLEVGYSRCLVRYSTHAIGGLSENDFICAAKVDALLAPPESISPTTCEI